MSANSKVQVRLAHKRMDSPLILTVFPSHQHFLYNKRKTSISCPIISVHQFIKKLTAGFRQKSNNFWAVAI